MLPTKNAHVLSEIKSSQTKTFIVFAFAFHRCTSAPQMWHRVKQTNVNETKWIKTASQISQYHKTFRDIYCRTIPQIKLTIVCIPLQNSLHNVHVINLNTSLSLSKAFIFLHKNYTTVKYSATKKINVAFLWFIIKLNCVREKKASYVFQINFT